MFWNHQTLPFDSILFQGNCDICCVQHYSVMFESQQYE